LLARRSQDGQVDVLGEEVIDQRRLTDPGGAFNQNYPGRPLLDLFELCAQCRQFAISSDEGVGAPVFQHRTPSCMELGAIVLTSIAGRR
jgi:hypothetical protein